MNNIQIKNLSVILILFIVILIHLNVNCQQYFPQNAETTLTKFDSIFASKIPELKLPSDYVLRGTEGLPYRINNAELPFFRPAFSQLDYWNCGQSAGIGYNFCYEINQSRNLPGNLPENQYSVNFTWNFMNTGDGWGVSYFHSFDILKACGNPNLEDYGGLFNGADKRWMSGYEIYENAMLNRISDVYSIDVGTPEGLLTLKHWLNDHMDGSQNGGVANFYFSFYNTRTLTDDSPGAGLPVIIDCYAPAGHAMTIVGYNDSIKYDINNDGYYTNNIDINNDGIVDMKDWEIGGLRYMNSTLNNDGYGFMMYRTLAYKYGERGIWNQQMHVIKVKDGYEPIATMRLKIKHDSRNKLKLIAGISQDTLSGIPEHSIDFPIFNYQGGDHYMQGNDMNESNKTIELSLDISPLLSYVNPGSKAKYFIQIAEKDELDEGQGEVLFYSVVDYRNSMVETISNQFPKPIANNTVTSLSLVTKIDFDKVAITTEELLAVVPGENSSCQITAEGGKMPYSWDVIQPYNLNSIALNFPENKVNQLAFENDDLYGIEIDLPFRFPFYNDTVESITVFQDGFIMFENNPFPYPYFIGEESMLKNNKIFAPFMTEIVLNEDENDGVWVNQFGDYIEVIWKASFEWFENSSNVEFAVRLFADGTIETHYGEMEFPDSKTWSSGISNGDNINYTLNTFYHQIGNHSFEAYEYKFPQLLPDNIDIDQNGLLSLILPDDSHIFNIVVQVQDNNGVIDRKNFQVPSGIVYEYEINAGNDDKINYFDTVSVKFTIRNTSSEDYQNVELNFASTDPYYIIIKDHDSVGTIKSQQTVVIDSALVLIAQPGIPDQHLSNISSMLSSDEKQWGTDIGLIASSPVFNISAIEIADNENGILEPGENAELIVSLLNKGHMNIGDIDVELADYKDYLIIEDPAVTIDKIDIGETQTIVFQIKAKQYLKTGKQYILHFDVKKENYLIAGLQNELLIGKIPVLILDLDPKSISGPSFMNLLDSLNLVYTYNKIYPDGYDQYMSVFICLGNMFDNAELTTQQAISLSSFLTNGGKIYMEGRVTWNQENTSILHNYFNIETASNGNYFEFDSIYGITDVFTENMVFDFPSSVPYNNHILLPRGNAYPVLNSVTTDSACVIAYHGENYKTIGSSIEFGNLEDTDSISTKRNYFLGILDFFELTNYLFSDVPGTTIRDFNELSIFAYPNPFNSKLVIEISTPSGSSAYLQIYDLSGRLVNDTKLTSLNNSDTLKTTIWDGRDWSGNRLPKGLYFIKVISDHYYSVKKVLFN